MPLSNNAIYVQTPRGPVVKWVNGTGTAKQVFFTAGANGAKIVSILVTNQDAVKTFNWYERISGVDFLLNQTTITALAGANSTIQPINLLDLMINLPTDNDGQKYFFMEPGNSLVGAVTVAMTGVTELSVKTSGGDF